jgi:hypothetical protein
VTSQEGEFRREHVSNEREGGMDESPTIKLAAVQAAAVWLDRETTVEKACRLIREAGENGADIVGSRRTSSPAIRQFLSSC